MCGKPQEQLAFAELGQSFLVPCPKALPHDQVDGALLELCRAELYEANHVQPLVEWAAKQGVTLRYQTSYGKDMETAAEWTETWNPKKDDGNYGTRGNGELNSGNYEQTFLDHIWHDQRAFASGVNQVVSHGYPYSGAYDGGAGRWRGVVRL